jgi:hypothetical protein
MRKSVFLEKITRRLTERDLPAVLSSLEMNRIPTEPRSTRTPLSEQLTQQFTDKHSPTALQYETREFVHDHVIEPRTMRIWSSGQLTRQAAGGLIRAASQNKIFEFVQDDAIEPIKTIAEPTRIATRQWSQFEPDKEPHLESMEELQTTLTETKEQL